MHHFAGPNTYGVGGKKRKEKKDRMTAAVYHGHLNASNESPFFRKSLLEHFSIQERGCVAVALIPCGVEIIAKSESHNPHAAKYW